MKKKYLMNAVAVLALGLTAASCSKDLDISKADIVGNAESALGVKIAPDHDWIMTQMVEANISVNGDYQANYDLVVYANNPFIENRGTVLGTAFVVSGSTAKFSFSAPSSLIVVYVALKDEKGYTYLKPAVINDGKLETSFGGNVSASAPSFTRAATVTRGAADDFTIPTREMPNLSAYIDDAVAIDDANNVTYGGGVEHYLIPEGTTWSKNIPLIQSGSGISVYVQGTLNINAEQRVNGGCVFIVGPKGTVNIASGQQLVTNANNNAGTVGSFYVYPGGKVLGEGTLQFANGTGSYNYNGGTINVGTINNNGGTLYNAGLLQAKVMEGGAGLSIYENAGKVYIGKCVKGSTTANTRIHNNCWWECDGDIYCRNIQQGAGAYIKGANLGMSGSNDGTSDAAYIWAKGNSLIDISGYVAFNNIDIVGPTGDSYAYLQFGEATGVNSYQNPSWDSDELGIAMNYSTSWDGGSEHMTTAISNNIRLSVDRPKTQTNPYTATAYEKLLDMLNGTKSHTVKSYNDQYGEWGTWNEFPQVGNGNATMVRKGEYTAAIVEESECTPGITPVSSTTIIDEPQVYTYAFEDTFMGDYDMNDVVLQVWEENGQLKIKLCATGASKDLYVYYDNNPLFQRAEVHQLFGAAAGKFVNTGASGAGDKFTTVASANWPVTEMSKPSGFDYATAGFNIRWGNLTRDESIWLTTRSDSPIGTAPYAVCIPDKWAWPTEWTKVSEAYPGNSTYPSFADYAGDPSKSTWYKAPDVSKTISPE